MTENNSNTPEDKNQPEKSKSTKKESFTDLYSPEQIEQCKEFVYINHISNTMEYHGTKAVELMDTARQHIPDLYGNMLVNLGTEYKRHGYLSKNSHRQVVYILFMWTTLLASKSVELKEKVKEAIEQARMLDAFSEYTANKQRMETKKGMVEFVTSEQMDFLLTHDGRLDV